MNDSKINIVYEDFDEDNIIVIFEKNGKNMSLTFGMFEFESEMTYWDMPTKLKKYNEKTGFIFNKNVDRDDLEMEINRFIKHNKLDK